MRTQRAADMVTGGVLAAVGVVAVLAALRIVGTAGERLHPRTLPYILGWTLLAGGVTLVVSAAKFRGPERVLEWPDRTGLGRVAVSLASLALYVLLLEPLGFPLATLLFVSFSIWFIGRYHPLAALGLGAASAAAVYVLFIRLLALPFPVGPLGIP